MQRLNKVRLSGRAGEIVFRHEHYGRYYYKFMLTVIRKSGAVDMFPIQISTTMLIISQLMKWKSWMNRFRRVI